MATPKVNPQDVGAAFLKRYFDVFSEDPASLYRFFKDDSTFVHGTEGDDAKPERGTETIKQRIQTLDFADATVNVSHLDCQESLHGSYLINVLGTLRRSKGEVRPFAQTIVLAPQPPNGFYVLNYVFRYFKEPFPKKDEHEGHNHVHEHGHDSPQHAHHDHPHPHPHSHAEAPKAESPAPAPAAPAPDAAADHSKKEKAAAGEKKGKGPKAEAKPAAAAPAAAPAAAAPAPAATAAAPAPAPTPAAPAAAAPAPAAGAKFSYAAAAAKSAPAPHAPASSAPAPHTAAAPAAGAAAASPSAPAVAGPAAGKAAPKPAPAAGSPKPGARPPRQVFPKAAESQTSLFVKNVPFGTSQEELTVEFSKYGKVLSVSLKKGYAFLEYEAPDAAQKLLDASVAEPISFGDRTLSIERRSGDGGPRGPKDSSSPHTERKERGDRERKPGPRPPKAAGNGVSSSADK